MQNMERKKYLGDITPKQFLKIQNKYILEHIIDQLHFIKMIQKKILSKMKFKDYWIIKFIKELLLK